MKVERLPTAANEIRDVDLIDAFVEDLVPLRLGDIQEFRNIDRWLLASQLQKSIRRGLVDLATSAALALARLDRDYLWRRIRIIALEDVGLGDLRVTATALAIAGKAKLHRDLGEERVIATVTAKLAASLKNRTACDVSCIAQYAPVPDVSRRSVIHSGTKTWAKIIADPAEPVWKRSLAFHLVGGLSLRNGPHFEVLSRLDLKVLQETLESLECPALVQYIAIKGRATEGLNTALPLAYCLTRNCAWLEWNDVSRSGTTEMIGPLLVAAFCMYTRVGNQANALLVRRDTKLRQELVLAGTRVPARAVGYLLFQTEGSLLDRKLDCPVSYDLLREVEHAELTHVGITNEGSHFRSMLETRMPALNDARREVARMFNSQQTLPGFDEP